MAGYKLPPAGGSYEDTLARVQSQAEAVTSLDRKERELADTQERGAGVQRTGVTVRSDLAGATEKLSSAIQGNIAAVEAETAAIIRSNEALATQLRLVNELKGARGVAAAGVAAAPIVQTTEQAQGRNAALAADRQAAERAATAQAVQADRMAISAINLRDAVGQAGRLSSGAENYLGSGGLGAAGLAALERDRRLGLSQFRVPRDPVQVAQFSQGGGVPGVIPLTGGRAFPTDAAGKLTAAGREAQAYEQQIGRVGSRISTMAEDQLLANQAFAQASTEYASASSALTRHGALTTEFLGALARGQVTLGEFGSQMTSTIGKFGGWAVAAGLVYGVYDAFKHVIEGASETQGAIQNLGRFIPGLGGPAGGGNAQVPQAEAGLRGLSRQFNLPISDVSDAAQVMARTFHTVSDTFQATAGVLALTRLDQVPQAQSEQYLVGIGNSLGITRGSGLVNVVNQLNALQATYGARVVQTLPGLARATPAALASGVSQEQLEGLVALGVRGGITGQQVGTALLRSMTNFAFSSGAAQRFAAYGITPVPGQYGNLVEQVMHTIDERARSGTLRGLDLTNLSRALGGPLLGGRSILPILAQEAQRPGFFSSAVQTAQRPRPYQEDLGAVLGSVKEQFRAIGIDLQNFGSVFAGIGLLTPLEGFLHIVNEAAHGLQLLAAPIAQVAGVFQELPGPLKDAIGLFVAFRAGQALLNTRFGGRLQQAVGRGEDQALVRGYIADQQTYIQPQLLRERESARLRAFTAAQQRAVAQEEFNAVAGTNPRWAEDIAANRQPVGGVTPEFSSFAGRLIPLRDSLAKTERQVAEAQSTQLAASRAYDQSRARVSIARGDRGTPGEDQSFRERAQFLQQAGYATRQDASLTQRTVEEEANIYRLTQERGELLATGNRLASEGLAAARTGASAGGAGLGVARGAASEAAGAAVLAPVVAVGSRQASLIQEQAARAQLAALSTRGQPFVVSPSGEAVLPGEAPPPDTSLRGTFAAARSTVLAAAQEEGGYGALARGTASDFFSGAKGFAEQNLSGPGGLFLGSAALDVLSSAVGQNTVVGRGAGNIQSGLMAALFAKFAGAGGGISTLVGVGSAAAQQFQQGGVGAGLASLAGGGAGYLLGSALAPETGGLSLLIPAATALLGSQLLPDTLGQLPGIGSLFRPPPSPEQQQTADAAKVQRQIGLALRGSRGSVSQAQANLEKDLTSAFAGQGGGYGQAQARLSGTLQQLQAEQSIYGPGSRQGQTANELLGTTIQGAIENAQFNPQLASQILQAAPQQQLQRIQRDFRSSLATGGPGSAQSAADAATGQYRALLQPWQQELQTAVTAQANGQKELDAAIASGNKKRQDAARQLLTSLTNEVAGAQSALGTQQADVVPAIQAVQDQAYQIQIAHSQALGTLAQARAGGSQAGQLQAQLATAQRAQGYAAGLAPYDPTQSANDLAAAQAQTTQIQTQLVQQHLTELKATGSVAEARVFTGDPVAQARQQLTNLSQQYSYMAAHRHAFDPADINQALAAVITARQTLAQAASDYATQMADIQGQIAQAEDYGNQVAQAADATRTATQKLAVARTPQQKATAQAGLLAARNQGYQAQQATIAAQGQLAEAQASGDPVRQAEIAISTARQALATAHGIDNIRTAETQLAQANYQLSQAEAQRIETLAQLQETLSTGDARRQAKIAISAAQQLLANAHTYDERVNAEQAMAAAEVQRRQAQQQYIAEVGQLKEARAGGNAVQAARITVQTAQQELAAAHGVDQVIQAEAQLAQAERQLRETRIQRIASIAQISETREYGNSVGQARTALSAARRELHVARGPDERRAAEQAVASAEEQLHQAQQSRISALGGLREAQAGGDPIRSAEIAIATANSLLRNAHGVDEQVAAETQLAQAQYQLHQAQLQLIQEMGGLGEALAAGDPIKAADIAVQTAEALVSNAHTFEEWVQAETALASAQYQLHQAQQGQITALGELAASGTREPLQQLADKISAARQVLLNATTDAERIQAQTNLNDLLNQYTSTFVSQTEETINFQLQMRQVTSQQAIAQLQGLLKTQQLTTQERQQIELQIRQLQLGGGTGEFNLAPGNIKLPTIYDIARAMGGVSGGAASPFGTGSVSATVNAPINVYVYDSSDVPAVAAAIDQATGSQVAGALRAAGLT